MEMLPIFFKSSIIIFDEQILKFSSTFWIKM